MLRLIQSRPGAQLTRGDSVKVSEGVLQRAGGLCSGGTGGCGAAGECGVYTNQILFLHTGHLLYDIPEPAFEFLHLLAVSFPYRQNERIHWRMGWHNFQSLH